MKAAALAAVIGVLASAVAAAVTLIGQPAVTAFEWSVYDRLPVPQPAGSPPIVIVRDAASESRFGPGSWDRGVIARLVTGLSHAGAAVTGLQASLDQPSAPGRGGAASDVLLSQALSVADNVVLAIALEPAAPAQGSGRTYLPPSGSLPGFAQHAKGMGHTLTVTDPDGVVRRVPLFVRVDERLVPAYGLALATALGSAETTRIPVDRLGRVLVSTGSSRIPRVQIVRFADVWSLIEERQPEALRNLVADRTVLVLTEPGGDVTRALAHANLFERIRSATWLRETPFGWTLLASALLSALVAWLWLALRGWNATLAIAIVALGYVAAFAASASLAGLLLPLAVPIAGALFASAAAFLWTQLGSAYRVRHLEGEVTAIREGLVRQESIVEALEEDLEAARAAVARSAGGEESLRAQLAAARVQEERTRARLEELEQRVRAASAVDVRDALPGDAELERLEREAQRMGIVTRDPAMLALFRDLEKAAHSALPILLTGEPGTGKELFARAAHGLSARAEGPFVAVNMGAIPAELFESEMFGHVRGSFTGAVADRKGYFEQANRGTIFLDEVGELRPEHQAKLLRVLQDKSFYRVGGTRPTTVDVRIVAASNRDLERGSAEGWFREDLYFRLKGLVLRLPPLRERPRDVPLLAERFVREAAAEVGRPALPLSESALAALERNDWPGNARELQNCLRQALTLADGAAITAADLRLPARGPSHDDSGGDEAVLATLRQHAFDMQATARVLGWDRSTVTQRLKGLGFRALVDAQGDRARAALTLAGDAALSRTVELKLREYSDHLLRVVEAFGSPDEAVAACRKRFKNLPERHFRSLELLVRQHFDRRSSTAGGLTIENPAR
jgi:DNA-binding NtrC family response regulator/CHASE2 domain-containing sensor protein